MGPRELEKFKHEIKVLLNVNSIPWPSSRNAYESSGTENLNPDLVSKTYEDYAYVLRKITLSEREVIKLY